MNTAPPKTFFTQMFDPNEELEVTRYAILDDDNDFLPGQPLFKSTWQDGLTEEIAKLAEDYLNSEMEYVPNFEGGLYTR